MIGVLEHDFILPQALHDKCRAGLSGRPGYKLDLTRIVVGIESLLATPFECEAKLVLYPNDQYKNIATEG